MNKKLIYRGTILHPEQGFILGNGDFCAAVYQRGDEIIWRLGKGDIWDRRYDYKLNPKPMDINELRHGIEVERWSAAAFDTVTYYKGSIIPLGGTDNPKRMMELCSPPPASRRPYPMPKPAGELAFRLPADFYGLKVTYRLDLGKGILSVECVWPGQAKLVLESFFAPDRDILTVGFKLECERFRDIIMPFPNDFFVPYPRWYFQLRRAADITCEEFSEKYGAPDFPICFNTTKQKTLPLPEIIDGPAIRQRFHPEATFPDGFEYTMRPYAPEFEIQLLSGRDARINLVPKNEFSGTVQIGIVTSLTTTEPPLEESEKLKSLCITAAKKFWDASAVSLGDKFLEKLWYETLQIQRSIYGRGPISPGLMVPCTIGDYARWHGDYHTNYNIQSPFFGMVTANHPELLKSYENIIPFIMQQGKLIAERYFHLAGVYVALPNMPIKALDDLYGNGHYVRMVYMTGWMWPLLYERYRLTGDMEYLRCICWPFLRECATFFTGFMHKGSDGRYHCYPSNAAEDHLNGNPEYFRDRVENLLHAKHTIVTALEVAGILDEPDYTDCWHDMLDNWPEMNPVDQAEINRISGNFYEFGQFHRWCDLSAEHPEKPLCASGHEFWTWYPGHAPMFYLAAMREGVFNPERDFDNLVALFKRWHEPNGAISAMAPSRYGRTGAWTETLGVMGVINEMLLSSRSDGVIELFPHWPKKRAAKFEKLRAAGAFLISAQKIPGGVDVYLFSERGGNCRLEYCGHVTVVETYPETHYHLCITND